VKVPVHRGRALRASSSRQSLTVACCRLRGFSVTWLARHAEFLLIFYPFLISHHLFYVHSCDIYSIARSRSSVAFQLLLQLSNCQRNQQRTASHGTSRRTKFQARMDSRRFSVRPLTSGLRTFKSASGFLMPVLFSLCCSNFATSAVQPVWWLAPMPAPLSPWKYS
jgi:hypothetical protein